MGFRASNRTPAEAYTEVRQLAMAVKSYAAGRAVEFQSDTNAREIKAVKHDMDTYLVSFQNALNSVNTAALRAFAERQEDDATYDAPAEYLIMRNLMSAVKDEVDLVLPDDSWIKSDGVDITYSTVPVASMTALVSALQSLDAHVE